jgi:hypothetical protein
MGTISEFAAIITTEREKIWLEAPSELENLKTMSKGSAGNYAIRLYAFSDTYRNQRNLWFVRNLLEDNHLDGVITKTLLCHLFQEVADRFDIWELQTPCLVFRKAGQVLGSAESIDDLVTLLDELIMYNNRWCLWLDSIIPWFDLDSRL